MGKVVAQIKVFVDPDVVRKRVKEALKIKMKGTSQFTELATTAGLSRADLKLALSGSLSADAELNRRRLARKVQAIADALGVEVKSLIQ